MSDETAVIVRDLLKLQGVTQETLGDKIGVHQSTINRWAQGADMTPPRYERLIRVARDCGVLSNRKLASTNGSSVLSLQKNVALQGYIGAGAAVLRVAHDTVTDEVERVDIPAAFGDVKALKVRGDSMYPAYGDGDILCFEPFEEHIDRLLGKECLVITASDDWLLKVIERGSRPQRYNLISHNAPPIRDVKIQQALPVRFVIKA